MGLVGAVITIVLAMNLEEFGSKDFANELFSIFGAITVCITFIVCIAAFLVFTDGGISAMNWIGFGCMVGGVAFGYVVGFFSTLAINGQASWFEDDKNAELHELHQGEQAS